MSTTIEVAMDLPFYLRVEDALTVAYEKVCQEGQVPELVLTCVNQRNGV